MGEETWFNLVLFFTILGFFFSYSFLKQNKPKNLPPGPRALPIVGHLHLLNFKQPIHRTLQQLSRKYGDVMFLQLGCRKVLVVSSAEAIEECFTKNDIIFANRPQLLSGKLMQYDYSTIFLIPYGDVYRNLRRLITSELLSANRVSIMKNIREEEVQLSLKELYGDFSDLKPVKVEIRSKLSTLFLNILTRMIAGKRYYGKDVITEEEKEFHDIMREVVELVGVYNLEDYLPVFQWVDVRGMKKRMMALMRKMDIIFQNLVEEHRKIRTENIQASEVSSETSTDRNTSFIDVMLSLQQTEPEYMSDTYIKATIEALIFAGTDSSSATIEWAMALLLNHPEAKKKALAEIESCVGHDRLLDDNDLPKLKYLNNVINETFRLFPPAPILVPHESSDDCTVGGFHIPKGTMLFANIWAVQKDPKFWEDSTKFKPERFDTQANEGLKYIPFGAGRRACPGATFGRRNVAHVLGTLIQTFDWERVGKEEIDMTEGIGLTMPMKEPLEVLCRPRETMKHLLSHL